MNGRTFVRMRALFGGGGDEPEPGPTPPVVLTPDFIGLTQHATYPVATDVNPASIHIHGGGNMPLIGWDTSTNDHSYRIAYLGYAGATEISEIVVPAICGFAWHSGINFQVYALDNNAWRRVELTAVYYDIFEANRDMASSWIHIGNYHLVFDCPTASGIFMVYFTGIENATKNPAGNHAENVWVDSSKFYGLLR